MEEDIHVGRAAIVGSGLICPERGGSMVRIPEHGGVVLLDHERPMMVDAFSVVLSHRPPSYGWLCLHSQQGIPILHFFS
jgi:hypothetical protein